MAKRKPKQPKPPKQPRARKPKAKKLLYGRQIIKQKVNVRLSTMGAAPVGGSPAAIPYPQYVSSYQSTPVVNAGGASAGQGVGASMAPALYNQFATSVTNAGTQTNVSPSTQRRPSIPAALGQSGQVQVPLSTRSAGDGPDAAPDMTSAFYVPPTASDRNPVKPRPTRSPPSPPMSASPNPAERVPRRESFYQSGEGSASRRQTFIPSYSPAQSVESTPPVAARVGLAPLT